MLLLKFRAVYVATCTMICLTSLFLCSYPAQADLVTYEFGFFNDFGSANLVEGTISFDGVTPGEVNTDLVPMSIKITKADGHDFGGSPAAYVLGSEIVGDTITWNDMYDLGIWTINAVGDLMEGSASFFHSHEFPPPLVELHSFSLDAFIGGGMLSTEEAAVFPESINTDGSTSFTVSAVPEPSLIPIWGLLTVAMVARRKRER